MLCFLPLFAYISVLTWRLCLAWAFLVEPVPTSSRTGAQKANYQVSQTTYSQSKPWVSKTMYPPCTPVCRPSCCIFLHLDPVCQLDLFQRQHCLNPRMLPAAVTMAGVHQNKQEEPWALPGGRVWGSNEGAEGRSSLWTMLCKELTQSSPPLPALRWERVAALPQEDRAPGAGTAWSGQSGRGG